MLEPTAAAPTARQHRWTRARARVCLQRREDELKQASATEQAASVATQAAAQQQQQHSQHQQQHEAVALPAIATAEQEPEHEMTAATPGSVSATLQAEALRLLPWQSARDLPERRLMVQRIITLTEKKRPTSANPAATRRRDRNGARIVTPSSEQAAALAKRIELSLYSRAGSLDEYKNTATLRRRLQSLVSLSFHEAAATKEASLSVHSSGITVGSNKRSRASPAASMASSICKRRRLRLTTASSSFSSSSPKPHSGVILGALGPDCLGTVFSFLDGRELLPLRAINRYAAEFLPFCVTSLEVNLTQMRDCLARDALRAMPNLERLVVFKTHNPCAAPTSEEQKLALHAWGCAELDVTQDNTGEAVVQQLALALTQGAGLHLRHLQLVSIFANTSQRNGLRALCNALREGHCPQLEHLLLGGNSITDVGVVDMARLLRSAALPQLQRLDLRRNYIGEAGLRRLMAALCGAGSKKDAQGEDMSVRDALQYLCMGGNLVTDQCVAPLIEMLERGVCPQMRFLGLEDNFLSPEGVETIIRAAESGGMVPRLHRVASDGGAVAQVMDGE